MTDTGDWHIDKAACVPVMAELIATECGPVTNIRLPVGDPRPATWLAQLRSRYAELTGTDAADIVSWWIITMPTMPSATPSGHCAKASTG